MKYSLEIIEPTQNAVIISYAQGKWLVRIECMDEELKDVLMQKGREILRIL